jgi:hypothetical protein
MKVMTHFEVTLVKIHMCLLHCGGYESFQSWSTDFFHSFKATVWDDMLCSG